MENAYIDDADPWLGSIPFIDDDDPPIDLDGVFDDDDPEEMARLQEIGWKLFEELREKSPNGQVSTQALLEAIGDWAHNYLRTEVSMSQEPGQGASAQSGEAQTIRQESLASVATFRASDDRGEGSGPTKRVRLEDSDGLVSPTFEVQDGLGHLSLKHNSFDLITALSQHTELAVELAKHLHHKDTVKLFSISRVFNQSISNHLLSSIRQWLEYKAPEALRVFPYRLYKAKCILDPAGRTLAFSQEDPGPNSRRAQQIRLIPSMRWFQMVAGRQQYVCEVRALMARNGLRLPPTIIETLCKIWLLMDVPTSDERLAMMRNKNLWPNRDIYNAQMFVTKLTMFFNDPVHGPESSQLVALMLGQRHGLLPLWEMIMRRNYVTGVDVVRLKLRYDVSFEWDQLVNFVNSGRSEVYGVPFGEIGRGHLEGWGEGDQHLARLDELLPIVSVERRLNLHRHLVQFVLWGYFDWATGENLVPTEEEIYIADEEAALANVDTTAHWTMRHVRKKRWDALTQAEQATIFLEEEDDKLRIIDKMKEDNRRIETHPRSWNLPDDFADFCLNTEVERGFIVHTNPGLDALRRVLSDQGETLEAYVDRVLFGTGESVVADEALKAQAWKDYADEEIHFDWFEYLAAVHAAQSGDEASRPGANGDQDSLDFDMDEDSLGEDLEEDNDTDLEDNESLEDPNDEWGGGM